jgi:hypothetical protein
MSAVAHNVADAQDLVGTRAFHVVQYGAERLQVTVNVGQDGVKHRIPRLHSRSRNWEYSLTPLSGQAQQTGL